jgi:hypothetical protein
MRLLSTCLLALAPCLLACPSEPHGDDDDATEAPTPTTEMLMPAEGPWRVNQVPSEDDQCNAQINQAVPWIFELSSVTATDFSFEWGDQFPPFTSTEPPRACERTAPPTFDCEPVALVIDMTLAPYNLDAELEVSEWVSGRFGSETTVTINYIFRWECDGTECVEAATWWLPDAFPCDSALVMEASLKP